MARAEDSKASSTKWVWLTKQDKQERIEQLKAGWVAHKDLQKKGVDSKGTFAPVASLAS